MCRNIKTLYNFDPPATEAEIQASAQQFIKKLTGFQKTAKVNQQAFDSAVRSVTQLVQDLFSELQTSSPAKNREEEAAKAKERSAKRFG